MLLRARKTLLRRASTWLWVACLVLCASACGGSQATKDLDAGFRRIQAHEARIERADRAVASAPARSGPTGSTCGPRNEAHEAAEAICAEAEALDDADARVRCERARTRSHDIIERAWRGCPTYKAYP